MRREPVDAVHSVRISLTTDAPPHSSVKALADLVALRARGEDDLVCLIADELQIDREDWLCEAFGLFERFPDAVMVGGRIRNREGLILSAGLVLGFGRGCDCPDRGRPALDPGYFTQMMKQRSVSAVSSEFAVLRAHTLYEVARELHSRNARAGNVKIRFSSCVALPEIY